MKHNFCISVEKSPAGKFMSLINTKIEISNAVNFFVSQIQSLFCKQNVWCHYLGFSWVGWLAGVLGCVAACSTLHHRLVVNSLPLLCIKQIFQLWNKILPSPGKILFYIKLFFRGFLGFGPVLSFFFSIFQVKNGWIWCVHVSPAKWYFWCRSQNATPANPGARMAGLTWKSTAN